MEATAHPKWQRELTERGWERESAISSLSAEQGGRAGGKWLLKTSQGNLRGHMDIWLHGRSGSWAELSSAINFLGPFGHLTEGVFQFLWKSIIDFIGH